MDGEQFSDMLYGDGPVPPPSATDCPVKLEMWWKYARVPPGTPVDLILAVGEQQSVVRAFDYLCRSPHQAGQRRAPAGALRCPDRSQADVRRHLAMVLPLTSLGCKMGSAREGVHAFGKPAAERAIRGIVDGAALT